MTCEQAQDQFSAFLSGELDNDSAGELAKHVHECPACAADMESMRRTVAALGGIGIRAMPEPVTIRIRQEVAKQRMTARRSSWTASRVWALAGTLPVVAALLVALMLFRQQPLTAAQIVARTQTAMTKLSSWHFRYKSTSFSGAQSQTKCIDEWYRAPDKRRHEELNRVSSTASRIRLIRGNQELIYDSRQKVANFRALSAKDQQLQAVVYDERALKPPYAASRYHMSDARVVGTDRVLGRPCDVVIGRVDSGFRLRMAVDRQTGVPLRLAFSTSDGSVLFRSEMVVFEPNKKLADRVFQAKLPRDVTIIRGPMYSPYDLPAIDLGKLRNPSQAEHELRFTLNSPGASALTAVYQPTYVPAGYMLESVSPSPLYVERATGRDRFALPIDTYYMNPKTGGSVLLIQSAKRLFEGSEAITVQGVAGHISSFTSPYPYSTLTWAKGGTYLTLIGSEVSRPEVVRVAEGLKPLGSLAPGLGTGPTWRITTQAVDASNDEYVAVTPDVLRRRFRFLGVYDATVERTDRSHIVITARANNPDLIARSVLAPGFVSFIPVPNASVAARCAVGGRALITQAEVDFRDRRGPGVGKPIFLNVRLRYPFYDVRLGKHDGAHANDLLAIVVDGKRLVATVTKGALIRGTQIGPLAPDVAAILGTTWLAARLRVISKERI